MPTPNDSRTWAVCLISYALLSACGTAHTSGDGGTAVVDAGTSPADAGTTLPIDGDVRSDAGVVDLDRDGVPAARDCDDADASVGESSTRACSSACGAGTESCAAGVWGACSAPTECACDTEGMMRTVPCGRCGLASQRCESGAWTMPSECLGESECFAGEIERDTAMCGERARICDDMCNWRDWTVVAPAGECEAGVERSTADGCTGGQTRTETCSVSCEWEETRACGFSCTRAAMASRTGADPVCIPAGPFVLGAPGVRPWSPEHEVVLSEFYIDRYPVTKARYEMCRAEGACPDPWPGLADAYAALSPQTYAAHMLVEGAIAFCDWDGGSLVGELQWEKAARGASPDRRLHSWGDADGGCEHHPTSACPTYPFEVSASVHPAAVSPYGVRLMGAMPERTSTPFVSGYAWVTPGVDPADPSGGERLSIRGKSWTSLSGYEGPSALFRRDSFSGVPAFRCVY